MPHSIAVSTFLCLSAIEEVADKYESTAGVTVDQGDSDSDEPEWELHLADGTSKAEEPALRKVAEALLKDVIEALQVIQDSK
jgi:hypothetical protein